MLIMLFLIFRKLPLIWQYGPAYFEFQKVDDSDGYTKNDKNVSMYIFRATPGYFIYKWFDFIKRLDNDLNFVNLFT